jgi:hypothetical protein
MNRYTSPIRAVYGAVPRTAHGRLFGVRSRTMLGIISPTEQRCGSGALTPSRVVERRKESHDVATVSIPLTKGKVALIDAEDEALVSGRRWRVQRGITASAYEYAVSGDAGKGTLVSMHRLILGVAESELVDHINSDGLDNRRRNLRPCSHTQNMQNRKIQSNNRSGFKGVYFHRGKGAHPWYAQLTANGRRVHIGAFVSPEEAARAYDKAAIKHHGEFARLNFPDEGSG